jgi:hypothetical protein
MFARSLCVILLLFPALSHALPGHTGSIPGRYHLKVCAGPCGTGRVLAEGTLVLLDAVLRDASGAELRAGGRDPLNGCFVFNTLRPHGLLDGPLTGHVTWRDDHYAGVLVNFGPGAVDASYVVILNPSPGRLAGKGYSSYGSEPRPPPSPPDTVVADRRGEATPTLCVDHMTGNER